MAKVHDIITRVCVGGGRGDGVQYYGTGSRVAEPHVSSDWQIKLNEVTN